MQLIHKIYKDGHVEHVDFNRGNWESALHDGDVVMRYTHAVERCVNYAIRAIEPVQTPKELPPPESPILAQVLDPIKWPPSSELEPWALMLLTTLGKDDCKDILSPPRRFVEVEIPKLTDERGQWSLF